MLLYISIIIAGVILDQLTKQFAVIWLSNVATLPIIPNVLHLTYVENTGAAFSLFSDMRTFLIIVTLIFIGILGYIFYILPKTKPYLLVNIALSLMLSGAIGNLLDRIRLTYVVDFFDFRIIGFAIFNVADVLVVVGTGLLVYALLKNHNLIAKFSFDPKKMSKEAHARGEQIQTTIIGTVPAAEEVVIRNISNIDITPVVQTELIQLPTKRSVEFEPTPPSYESIFNDEIIKIYEPKKQRDVGTESNTGIISVEEILSELNASEPVVIKKENRYSKSSEKYEEMVQKLRSKKSENDSQTNKRNRYRNSTSSYEQSIKDFKNREKRRETQKQEESWEPYRTRNTRKTSGEYSPFSDYYESETTARRLKNRKSKYANMIDSYENLVNSNRNQKKQEEPHWESKKPEVKEPVVVEVEEVIDTTPVRRNRYSDSTDSYIESIKRAAQKEYTSKNQKN